MTHRQAQVPDVVQLSEHDEKIRRLGMQTHRVMADFKELDRRLSTEGVRSRQMVRMLVKQRNFVHHRQRLAEYSSQQLVSSRSPSSAKADHSATETTESVSAPFTNLCERILLQNRIWQQQKDIKSLQNSLSSMKASSSSNAFQAFCDRLLLSNGIWKLQKEVSRLTEEIEKLKRSRVVAVTRAAKQMVQDVRKERLTEEFVKELITEVEECRQAVVTLRAEHEKEIQELAQEWRKDCRQLVKQVERLKLAQEARIVEQGLSNEMESELLERLAIREQKAQILKEKIDPHPSEELYLEDDLETLSGGSDLEEMSNMSTSTYVGSAGQCSPNVKFTFEDDSSEKAQNYRLRGSQLSPLKMLRHQSSSSSLRKSASGNTPIRKVDTTPYAGFSFNPLFFSNASIARKEGTDETGSPVTPVTFTLKSPPHGKAGSLPSKSTTKSMGKQTLPQKRVQWRV